MRGRVRAQCRHLIGAAFLFGLDQPAKHPPEMRERRIRENGEHLETRILIERPLLPLDRLNLAVLKRVIENGRVYLSNATIRGKFALRACFVNHRTKESDVAEIVPEALAAARAAEATAS